MSKVHNHYNCQNAINMMQTLVASAVVSTVILSGCGGDSDDTTKAPATTVVTTAAPTLDIVALAQSVDDLSTLVKAVVAGDLVGALSNETATLTVFAPTNAAFDALPAGTLDNLLKPENKDDLVGVLTYHVLPEVVYSTDLKPTQTPATLQGSTLSIVVDDTGVHINDVANVTSADNGATNGVVHIIDGVLIPATSITV